MVMSFFLVRLKGFEPPTFWFVAKHSIQLSYSRIEKLECFPDSSFIIAQSFLECKHYFPHFTTFFCGMGAAALCRINQLR